MAIFDDLLKALSGATGVAVGSQMLQQKGAGTTSVRGFTPSPSPAEQQGFQLSQALQLANLQHAGYDVTRAPDGSMTLTPRETPETRTLQQLGPGTISGLQREMGGPSMSPLGGVLNTQALAGATGRPSINRQALIQAIQQRQGQARQPTQGLNLGGDITPITVPQMSSEASSSGFSMLGQAPQQQKGLASSFTSNLPMIAGGVTALAPFLQALGLGFGGDVSQPASNFDVDLGGGTAVDDFFSGWW